MSTPNPNDNEPQPTPRGERALVRRLAKSLHAPQAAPISPPFGDDMAPLPGSTSPLLWTVDMLSDGVDFQSAQHDWRAIGRKAMAVNLSDCAAMAVQPVAALCAVCLNNDLSMNDAADLIEAAHAFGLNYNCPIVGGDTNSWDAETAISMTIAAAPLPDCPPVRRDGAKPGDQVWLTGPVGGSILGRHMTFEPRVRLAINIARQLHPHAMIDISDGLAIDLSRIAEASGCGAMLDETALDAAIHPDAVQLANQDQRPARDHALHDGEDFELIVILPQAASREVCQQLGLLAVGTMIPGSGLRIRTADGQTKPLSDQGWEHFR
jgi:thiamine-monophosphate kinase